MKSKREQKLERALRKAREALHAIRCRPISEFLWDGASREAERAEEVCERALSADN